MTGLAPYLTILLAGFLPNEAFRLMAVLLARRVDPDSKVFTWVKIVATTLLAAVVSRLIYAPAASLAVVPAWVRVLGIVVGVASFYALRCSLILGILVGEAVFVALAWQFA